MRAAKRPEWGDRRRNCDGAAMCADRKQTLNAALSIVSAAFIFTGTASAGAGVEKPHIKAEHSGRTAGGVAIGDGSAGVTDRAWVNAPPHYLYVIEKERGSFLDCGEGKEARAVDEDGRDMAPLRCGVTLTETIVIPAAAASARLIVHF